MTNPFQDYGRARLKKVEDKMEIIENEKDILEGKVRDLLRSGKEFKILSILVNNESNRTKIIRGLFEAKNWGHYYCIIYKSDYVTYIRK